MRKILLTLSLLFVPVFVFAQPADRVPGAIPPDAQPALDKAGTVVGYLVWFNNQILNKYAVPILIALGLVLFLFGLLKYITAGADEEKRTAGRNLMIYGIIALFVMVSVWGLVAILNRTFGVGQGGTNTGLPEVPTIEKTQRPR